MITARFLFFGTLLLFVGVLGMGLHLFGLFENMTFFTITSVLAAMGAFSMVLGVVGLSIGAIGETMGDFKSIHAGDSAVFSVGLLRCMLSITIADGRIDDAEIEQMKKIFSHLTESSVDEELIRYVAEEMLREGETDIAKEMKYVAPTLNTPLKKNMILASLYILAADGDLDDNELLMLDDIREALGMSFSACEKIKAEFFKTYAGEMGIIIKENKEGKEEQKAIDTPATAAPAEEAVSTAPVSTDAHAGEEEAAIAAAPATPASAEDDYEDDYIDEYEDEDYDEEAEEYHPPQKDNMTQLKDTARQMLGNVLGKVKK